MPKRRTSRKSRFGNDLADRHRAREIASRLAYEALSSQLAHIKKKRGRK